MRWRGGVPRVGMRPAVVSRQFFLGLINLAVFLVLTTLRPETFLSWTNFKAVLSLMSYDLLLAVAMTMVLIVRGLDLSVGSVMALLSVVMALFLQAGVPIPVALAAGLALAIVVGLINGLLVTKVGILPFLVTLGTMSIARGVATVLSTGQYVSFPAADRWFTQFGRFEFRLMLGGQQYGFPVTLLVTLTVVALFGFLLSRWTWLRRAFYVGESPDAALLAGIRVDRVTIVAYVIAALMVWIAATLIISNSKIGYANYGIGAELRALAAAVVGGASMAGGAGSVFGTFLGVLMLALIGNGFVLLNGSPDWQQATIGIVLIAAVGIDALRTYRQRR